MAKDRYVYVSSGVGVLGSFSVFLAESTILVTLGGNGFGHHSECICSCFVLWGYFLKIVFH